jgi:hypothetical protein
VEAAEGPSRPEGDKIGAEVDRRLSDGLELGDIAIVSLRGQTAPDAIFNHERVGRHALVRADAADMAERLVADSFLRWKGLERSAVIVTDLPEGSSRNETYGATSHLLQLSADEGRLPDLAQAA